MSTLEPNWSVHLFNVVMGIVLPVVLVVGDVPTWAVAIVSAVCGAAAFNSFFAWRLWRDIQQMQEDQP